MVVNVGRRYKRGYEQQKKAVSGLTPGDSPKKVNTVLRTNHRFVVRRTDMSAFRKKAYFLTKPFFEHLMVDRSQLLLGAG